VADRRLRPCRETPGDVERALLELVRGNAERDEADPLRLLAADRLAQEQVVFRLRHPAEQGPHENRMVTGRDAQSGVAVDDARARCRDAHVREQRHRQACADCRAVDRRDNRLAAVDDVVDEVARLVEHAEPRVPVARDVLDEREVAAGAERAAGAADEDDARLLVPVDLLPDLGEVPVRLVADGVELAGRVQREPEDPGLRPVELEARKLVVHMAEPNVLVERDGSVATVRLNRPKQLNALSGELMEALGSALRGLDEDAEIRVIVVAGNERAFAAGADIDELAAGTAISLYEDRRIEAWDSIRAVRTPLVAAVSGYCLGGGCELAMLCDLIVASESAKFGQPEINLGVLPGAGGTQRLARAVGKAVAMDMILTGRMLSAREALDFGLVARVVAKEAWLTEAKRVAHEIASKGPIAVRLAKEAVDEAFEAPLAVGIAFERRSFYLARASEDAEEGLNAFVEKRPPDFKGK
jgi:enoyl-CoA hydratase